MTEKQVTRAAVISLCLAVVALVYVTASLLEGCHA